MILSSIRGIAFAAFSLAAVNFVTVTILGSYDFHLGPVHLVATYLFKPLLYLNAAFLVKLALQASSRGIRSEPTDTTSFQSGLRFWIAAVVIVAAVYAVSFRINLDFPDWTHRSNTIGRTPWSFFVHRQYDGFYRPLTFVSLWIDNQIFGSALWGYHIQNLLLHLLNGWLVARLAFRLGLKPALARWAGIAFLAVPASFEAVIWPGARFDLMAATFTLFALERALAGSVAASTASYCLGVLSKESAYAYPLLLCALFLLRRPLGLKLRVNRWAPILYSSLAGTIALVLIRIAVYGNLGGYPDPTTGGNVNFVLTTRSFTSIATRFPSVLFLINSGAGLPVWLRVTLIAYVAFLSLVLFEKASAGKRTLLLVLPFLSVVPMVNMFGWMTQFAQEGRYLYHPVVWIVFVLVCAVRPLRYGSVLLTCWIVIMGSAALFNTLAYVQMIRMVKVAVAEAATSCRTASCCQTLWLRDVPRDLYGAFYFHYQVAHDLQKMLPGVAVVSESSAAAEPSCTVELQWTDQNQWLQTSSGTR